MTLPMNFHDFRPADGTDPDPILAAVPGLLGFVPEQSVVLVIFDHDAKVLATLRHDLMFSASGAPHPELCETFAQVGASMPLYDAAGAVLVVVDERFDVLDPLPAMNSYRRIVACADEAFAEAGGVAAGFAMRSVAAGSPWHAFWQPDDMPARAVPCLFDTEFLSCGRLSDPETSSVALDRAVQTGRRVMRRRSDIPAMLRPIGHCTDEVCRSSRPVAARGPRSTADRGRLGWVIDRIEAGDPPSRCVDVDRAADAITSVHVRDALLGLAVTGLRPAAEQVWCMLTRRLTGTAGAAAATLLGHLYYAGGEGVYAGVVLEHALSEDPDYRLADLLFTALTNGMHPSDMGGLVELSFEVAADLGRPLPPLAAWPGQDRSAG
ncbi:MAG: DUF4192 domain-containing protein [Gordonia sp. (in: high G+C Gram-positive bacteria)]